MQSPDQKKYYSLKKELAKVLKQPVRDREHVLMLETEIAKLEVKLNLNTK